MRPRRPRFQPPGFHTSAFLPLNASASTPLSARMPMGAHALASTGPAVAHPERSRPARTALQSKVAQALASQKRSTKLGLMVL